MACALSSGEKSDHKESGTLEKKKIWRKPDGRHNRKDKEKMNDGPESWKTRASRRLTRWNRKKVNFYLTSKKTLNQERKDDET